MWFIWKMITYREKWSLPSFLDNITLTENLTIMCYVLYYVQSHGFGTESDLKKTFSATNWINFTCHISPVSSHVPNSVLCQALLLKGTVHFKMKTQNLRQKGCALTLLASSSEVFGLKKAVNNIFSNCFWFSGLPHTWITPDELYGAIFLVVFISRFKISPQLLVV